MKHNHELKWAALTAALAFGGILASPCRAGQELKWADVPAAVQATVLANGGVAGQTVDLENGKKNGLPVYEAGIRDKDGSEADLVITGDGKLVNTKHDDASDRAEELAKAAKAGKAAPAGAILKFSHPRDIYNPYLPLAYLQQDVIEGSEGGKHTRVERTIKPDQHRTFTVNGQTVEALAFEDRDFENGEVAEVTLDYFAQDDFGNVYYLGEDVDEYTNGKVTGHDGAWLYGKDTQNLGVLFPAHPQVGDKFVSEDVSKEIRETDEVMAVDETVTVPAGTFTHCVKIKESLGDGTTEFKDYAPGVGVVREMPPEGDELLISHQAK
jgi:hypothetical protein